MAANMLELGVNLAIAQLAEFFEEDALELVGVERHQRGPRRAAYRYGSTNGLVTLGGQQLKIQRPRVRMDGGEMVLPSYAHFSSREQIDERSLLQVLAGVTSRRYKSSLETDGIADTQGASKSAMNRRFLMMTAKQLETWLARRLDGEEYLVIMIDGIVLGETTVVGALGITSDGHKRLLGAWDGATENSEVCQMLLDDLIRRGLDAKVSCLFVLDGAKALHKAVRDTFGKRMKLQRCQVHKIRNVTEQLPKELRASVKQAMHQAYQSGELKVARQQLLNVANRLKVNHPRAAASVLEGLEETLTVIALNLPAGLRRLLATTNALENTNGTLRSTAGKVKRWRNGQMALRWVVTSFVYAERRFRVLYGHKNLLVLRERLRAHDQEIDACHKVATATTEKKAA